MTVDPRDIAEPTQVGTPLRDAAVDPRPSDFLPPTNAGEANPHGPEVVAPGLHADEHVRPIRPGEVHVDDPAVQSDAELEHTATVHTDGVLAAVAEAVPGDVYDPAGYSVADVNEHLASVDDGERARILDAERAGKARKGILGDA